MPHAIKSALAASETAKAASLKYLLTAIWFAWRTQWLRAQHSIKHRGRDRHVGTCQTYHQDQHPDRTFHVVLLTCAKSLGVEPHGGGIIQRASSRPVFSDRDSCRDESAFSTKGDADLLRFQRDKATGLEVNSASATAMTAVEISMNAASRRENRTQAARRGGKWLSDGIG